MTFERVHTVWEYYDGPRDGLADFRGQPHFYKCVSDEDNDDGSALYALVPIDEETLQLAKEQYAIWLAWDDRFRAGQVPLESHPGYGGKNARYDELEAIIKSRIPSPGTDAPTAEGKFEVVEDGHVVTWRQPPNKSPERTRER